MRPASAWARAFEAPVKVLHVIETPPSIEGSAVAAVEEIPEVFEVHRNEALAELRKLLGSDWKGLNAPFHKFLWG